AEGKNREVRRVLEALGLTVNRLIRLAYGPFALGTLEVGEIEEVGPRVIREQLADFVAEANMPSGDRPQFQKTSTPAPGPRRGAVEIERGNLRREDRPARYSPPNRRRGGGEIRNGPTGGAGASSTRASSEPVSGRGKPARAFDKRARPAADAPAKKDYKPGWAKPRPGKPVAAKAAGARPSGVRTSGAKRSAAPGAARAGAPSSGPRSGGAASSSPRPSGPRGPNARAPTTGSPHAGGSRAPAGRPGRPSGPSGPKGAARPAGPRASGPPRPGGSKPGGFKPGGSRPGGGKPRGPKQR
ncbi:MAG: pseudouridine synthase, Rsu, partial [Phenylobacterium sp.]|nr:pseudouridine synthase, Rsu [Phenylobacterium sp.]